MNLPKKSLGQNYLIDKNVINKIIKQVKIKNKNVLEIGPGTANLTDEIIKEKPKSLILIEKDKYLFSDLKNKFNDKKNIHLFNADFLKFNLLDNVENNTIVFGNLPYHHKF
jgi:16S rRNA (adenine1518-N6/adenine1519-N6)-dimethyltransferase